MELALATTSIDAQRVQRVNAEKMDKKARPENQGTQVFQD